MANQSQTLCGASLGMKNKILLSGQVYITKMMAMAIYGKNLEKNLFRACEGISTRHGLKHQGLWPIIVYINLDIELILAYFTARSNMVT